MNTFKKYIQQILIMILLVGTSAVSVFAAPKFPITDLVSGFIRLTSHVLGCGGGIGPAGAGSPACHLRGFHYGYGWSGNFQAWGYGYGYDNGNFDGQDETTRAASYGFDGNDGSVTIEGVDVTQTTADITYSTNYLARFAWAVGTGYPVDENNAIAYYDNSTDYFSGPQQINVTDLKCGATYYFLIAARDAGHNNWFKNGSFRTKSCPIVGTDLSHRADDSVIALSPRVTENTSHFQIPNPLLSLGSLGTDVQNLQILLNTLHIFLDTHTPAGTPGHETTFFGPKTYAAVKRFQLLFGLKKVDGIYGPETQGMFEGLLK